MPINVSAKKTLDLANILNCQVGVMPFTYLGLPLGTTRPTINDLMPLADKIERRLTGCSILLSYDGRLKLIKLVSSSLPIFFICTLLFLPASPIKLTNILGTSSRWYLGKKNKGTALIA